MIQNPILTINGADLLKSYYSIYISKVINDSLAKPLLYVGKTGDNNHKSARPVFRRMAGHLQDYPSSKENQLYQGIARHLKQNLDEWKDQSKQYKSKAIIEEFLTNSAIEVFSYKLKDFDHSTKRQDHNYFVRKLNHFEKQIINLFLKNKVELINGYEKEADYDATEFPEIFQQIKNDFKLK